MITYSEGVPSPKNVFVAAPTRQVFEHWCRRYKINPRGRHIHYLSNPHDLRGHREAHLMFLDGWENGNYIYADHVAYLRETAYLMSSVRDENFEPVVHEGNIVGWRYAENR